MVRREVQGQPSWRIDCDAVEAWVTEVGAHVGPVSFRFGAQTFSPYSVNPWANEDDLAPLPPILRVLRGDFFCLPFGGNETPFEAEQHPIHGETANALWSLVYASEHYVELELNPRIRPCYVRRRVEVREGEHALYQSHEVDGLDGPMNVGMHAMLAFTPETGPGLISVAPFVWGQVFPDQFELPEQGGYPCLRPGARFERLDQVPGVWHPSEDLSRYPAREGFEDLVMVVTDPSLELGWTAAVYPESGFVWLSVRRTDDFASTVMWHSNGGRHYPPWNGRHRGVLGLEDVTSYFHYGLAESVASNPVQQAGHPTCIRFEPDRPRSFRSLHVAGQVPEGFGHVRAVERQARAFVISDGSGRTATLPCDPAFLD